MTSATIQSSGFAEEPGIPGIASFGIAPEAGDSLLKLSGCGGRALISPLACSQLTQLTVAVLAEAVFA